MRIYAHPLETSLVSERKPLREAFFQPLQVQVTERDEEGRFAKVEIYPLARGYGASVGNPLRRILLSSILGAGITYVQIRATEDFHSGQQEFIVHHFRTIPGVRESVMELILNLRKVPLRLHGEEGDVGKVRLRVRGYKEAKSSDLKPLTPNVEIVDPNVYICTVEDEGWIEVEAGVRLWRGYVPSERHWPPDLNPDWSTNQRFPTGIIPVDSDFSPVERVAIHVEPMRVGRREDYERLTLQIWTNGAITPVEALKQAIQIFVDWHWVPILNALGNISAQPTTETGPPLETPLSEVPELSNRTVNILLRNFGISTLGELLAIPREELEKGQGIGEKTLKELDQVREKYGGNS